MAELLYTKLHIPQVPRHHLLRAPLLQRLNQGLIRRLTVIAAPAGFGKSTLAAEWLRELRKRSTPSPAQCSWFTIDATDNDPSRFLAYLAAALAVRVPPAAPSASIEVQLIPLLNQLTTRTTRQAKNKDAAQADQVNDPAEQGIHGQQILVLDDYHLIENEAIDQALTFLIDHAPPSLHLCITTRVDPNMPLHRWRARQQLTEVRAHDLRFTAEEGTRLLSEKLALPITRADIHALNKYTEGWIAALQMVAQSLLGRSAEEISIFVHGFRGNHRFILDYLVEEVLNQQPPTLRHFLVQTAILNRLCAPLCAALLTSEKEETDSEDIAPLSKSLGPLSPTATQAILEELESKNLFIFALDDERRWFRYHHLFADFLQIHLAAGSPATVTKLHRRAAHWFANADLMDEAIDHALQGDATDLAAEWIAQIASSLLQRGELLTLKRLIGKLPSRSVNNDYRLALTQAWASTAVMEHRDPEPDFDLIATLIETQSQLEEERRADLLGQVLVMRTTWAVSLNQIDHALSYGEEAFARLPAGAHVMRNLITLQLGNAYRIQGDIQKAMAQYRAICEQGAAINDALVIYITHHHYGRLLRLQGELQSATRLYESALRINSQLREETLLVGLAHLGMAEVHWERWELDTAFALVQQAIEECRRAGMTEGIAFGFHLLTRIHFARQEQEAAESAITAAQPYLTNIKEADGLQWERLYALRYALLRPELHAAQPLIHELLPILDEQVMAADLRCELRIALAEAQLLCSQPDSAHQLLARHAAENPGSAGLLEHDRLLLQAVAHYRLGETNIAIELLSRAIAQATKQGWQRPFFTYEPMLAPLLTVAIPNLETYAVQFIRSVAPKVATASNKTIIPNNPTLSRTLDEAPIIVPTLVEPLSEREQEILAHIAAGRRNQEIADTLMITLNTVRYHTKNLYGKLGVNSRTQAVAKAQQMGLL